MSLLEAFLPGLFVVGICLAVNPFMPRDEDWAHTLVTGLALIVTLRYMLWRLSATVLPPILAPWTGFGSCSAS